MKSGFGRRVSLAKMKSGFEWEEAGFEWEKLSFGSEEADFEWKKS
jgi:hypothetical protein